jgi:hypothetical protein
VSGLPSFVNPDLDDIGGPQDIDMHALGFDIVTIGWGACSSPTARCG